MASKTVTEKDVEMWLSTLPDEEVDEVVDTLALRREGKRFVKLARIQKWLSGDYDEEDFEQTANLEDKNACAQERLQISLAFLHSCCNERHNDRPERHRI